jgi:glycine dehydrogenase
MPYIGINENDKESMLNAIGIKSIDELFLDIPENLLLKRDLNLDSGLSEWELLKYFKNLEFKNQSPVDFKGAACYRHHVPSLVKAISSRGEFLTSYTPYQPEVSQGTLETIYKFQSYMSDLTGMDLCNASMYDGATALAEALTMSHRLNKERKIYLSKSIHPEYLEVSKNYLDSLEVSYQLFESWSELEDSAIIAIQNPDFFGELLSPDARTLLKSLIKSKNLFLIYLVTEPFTLLGMDKPSALDAQIVCGSAQSFGNPVYYGGTQVGFIACREEFVRQMPGRIVGKTVDRNNKSGYVLTFQTREQHIKRERATSNICTNQSLHALCAAVYLSLMGERGLKNIAKIIWAKTGALKNALKTFPDIKVITENPFNEFLVELSADTAYHNDLHGLFSQYAVNLMKVSREQSDVDLFLLTVSELHDLDDLNCFLEKISDTINKNRSGTKLPSPRIRREDIEKLELAFSELPSPAVNIPNKSELDVCRYFTKLSQKNFSIDTNFYPLGSCTMKYNPKINDEIASSSTWCNIHPYEDYASGILDVFDELNRSLCEITGMHEFSLQAAAGAHGEYTALLMAKKYFADKSEERDIVLVPDSAHGTNPASATMSGFKTIAVASDPDGNVDLNELQNTIEKHRSKIAVFMLTNPNTFGLFDQNIVEAVRLIHQDGGLMYYDGANLNAIMGICRPGDMGFDLLHLNLHKSFSTPHGGGGPGAGPVGASQELQNYLPYPRLMSNHSALYWDYRQNKSVGRIRSFFGNFNVLIRALAYIKRNGKEGLKRIGETAVLNANYLQARIRASAILSQENLFSPRFKRLCKHEFIVSASKLKEKYDISALDIAKRLLDKGIHAPTIYFPISIPEAIMIEPTETESKDSLDALIKALEEIVLEAATEEGRTRIKSAPNTTPLSRFNEVKAVREPILSEVMERKALDTQLH